VIVRAIKAPRFASNCYVVGSETTGQGLIIDPGADDDVLGVISELGLSIPLMVATHTHIDHIFAVRRMKEEIAADFAVHEAEGPGNMQLLPE